MKLVLVTWLDALRGDADPDITSPTFGIERKTVGHLLKDNKDGVLIAMSKDGKDYERWFSIPRAYVKEVKRLQ